MASAFAWHTKDYTNITRDNNVSETCKVEVKAKRKLSETISQVEVKDVRSLTRLRIRLEVEGSGPSFGESDWQQIVVEVRSDRGAGRAEVEAK